MKLVQTNKIPYPYYFYGSHDSMDEDVIICIPRKLMPKHQEARKQLMFKLKNQYQLSFNATLAVIENGIIEDTIYPKTWVDSLNNALFYTYKNHLDKQVFENPIKTAVKRNKLLSIYKCTRTVLSMLTRTHYRPLIKPIIKGCHPFNLKIEALNSIDFRSIQEFYQKNTKDQDIWKMIAFYVGQNISLINDNIEIYTKSHLIECHPKLSPFIRRSDITDDDKVALNCFLKEYVQMLMAYGSFECKDFQMHCNGETINMRDEISL